MIQTIAVINTKGGVGKSTAVAALAEIISVNTKKRVLVLDLDPQANASLSGTLTKGARKVALVDLIVEGAKRKQKRKTAFDY